MSRGGVHAADPGEILLSQRLNASVEADVPTEELSARSLKGFSRHVPVFRLRPDGDGRR